MPDSEETGMKYVTCNEKSIIHSYIDGIASRRV